MAERDLSADDLRCFLDYNENTGVFVWRQGRKGINIGDVAGTRESDGYIRIRVAGAAYRAHRMAVLYVTGEWPKNQVDHINGDKSDNRFCNLRECDNSQNSWNRSTRRDCASGAKGVERSRKSGKFEVRITCRGERVYVGSFDTITDATAAYADASDRLHSEFSRTE